MVSLCVTVCGKQQLTNELPQIEYVIFPHLCKHTHSPPPSYLFSSLLSSLLPSPPPSLSSHDRILEAVTVNGEMCNISRFDPVLTALNKTSNPMLQLSCLQFINAIVNTPEEIDFKMHLRNEFMRGGLGDMLLV